MFYDDYFNGALHRTHVIYLFQCLKRVYSEGFWVRLIKSFVLALIYVLILGSSLSVLAFIAVLLV